MGQMIEVGYGKANLSNTLTTYAVMKVTEPFARVSGVTAGKREGYGTTHQVGRHEMTGALINCRVEHDNGTVLLIQTGWKRSGIAIRDGALFMRLRAGAPLYRITAKVPLGPENLFGEWFTVFSGYADIMNEADLQVLGLKVPRQYLDRYMSTEELEECFEINQLAAPTQSKPQLSAIATPEGIQMRELSSEPIRRLRFRRSE